jgi:hypothetical protein
MIRFASPLLILVFLSAKALTGEKESPQDRYVRLVNELRTAAKVPPLKADPKLMAAAQKHAETMARLGKTSDDGKSNTLEGKTLTDRLIAENYARASARYIVYSNVAPVDPVGAVVKSLQALPPHREVMLGKEWTQTGTGVARSKSGRWYFSQIVARPSDTPGGKAETFACTVVNATEVPLTLRVKAANFVEKIPAGNTYTINLTFQSRTGAAPMITAEVSTEKGKATSFQLVRDGRFTVTGDEKQLKVEKAP